MHHNNYNGFFNIKLNLEDQVLINNNKVLDVLQKSIQYITKNLIA